MSGADTRFSSTCPALTRRPHTDHTPHHCITLNFFPDPPLFPCRCPWLVRSRSTPGEPGSCTNCTNCSWWGRTGRGVQQPAHKDGCRHCRARVVAAAGYPHPTCPDASHKRTCARTHTGWFPRGLDVKKHLHDTVNWSNADFHGCLSPGQSLPAFLRVLRAWFVPCMQGCMPHMRAVPA